MAMMLQRAYDLFVLWLSLEAEGREYFVRCRVEGTVEQEVTVVDDWRQPAESFGLPARLEPGRTSGPGYPFVVPDEMLERVRQALGRRENPAEPLWLHLVKPYGYLGFVPWELLLQPALGVPMLRLPDFLSNTRRDDATVLDVVVCASMPDDEPAYAAPHLVDQLVRALLMSVPRRLRIDVFGDSLVHSDLRSRWQGADFLSPAGQPGSTKEVTLHDPEAASFEHPARYDAASGSRHERLTNPWFVWVREALGARSADVVHFLGHGYLAGDRGALALTESPQLRDRGRSRLVCADEVLAFTTQVGAWSAVFGSPPQNYSEMGLRALADELAQSRPGPVVHHEARLDPNLLQLVAAYQFLFGARGTPPPATPALFLYCHPARAAASAAGVARLATAGAAATRSMPPPEIPAPARPGAPTESSAESSGAPSGLAPDEEAPAWYSAAERYFERRRLELGRLSRDRTLEGRSTESAEKLQSLLDRAQRIAVDSARGGGSES